MWAWKVSIFAPKLAVHHCTSTPQTQVHCQQGQFAQSRHKPALWNCLIFLKAFEKYFFNKFIVQVWIRSWYSLGVDSHKWRAKLQNWATEVQQQRKTPQLKDYWNQITSLVKADSTKRRQNILHHCVWTDHKPFIRVQFAGRAVCTHGSKSGGVFYKDSHISVLVQTNTNWWIDMCITVVCCWNSCGLQTFWSDSGLNGTS